MGISKAYRLGIDARTGKTEDMTDTKHTDSVSPTIVNQLSTTDSVEAMIQEFEREFPELHNLGQHSTTVVMDERDTRNIHDWIRKKFTTVQAIHSQQVEEARETGYREGFAKASELAHKSHDQQVEEAVRKERERAIIIVASKIWDIPKEERLS